MANFTVRVVLHGVDDDDSELYTELHEAMRKQGFRRDITIGGSSWKLPPAEYSKVSADAGSVVLAAAKKAAFSVMGNERLFSLLLTEGGPPRLFHNLELRK
ncbi:hypothetical protein [Cupriavidus pauculus]|uniref:hypothetical protein n=1 Tax=Cupriavidus pauculus TaxID=82633 RepID=UPI001D0C1696|nr:hypothetical protein [Cupriavidus pauculus]